MGMDVQIAETTCLVCGTRFMALNGGGPCDECRPGVVATFWASFNAAGGLDAWAQFQAERAVQLFGWPKLDTATWQPVPGDTIKCGNRADLVKKQRRHWWLDAGEGTLHDSDGSYKQVTVYICARCGTTKYTTLEGT